MMSVPLSRTHLILSSAELRGLCVSVTALSDFCEQEQRINEGAYTDDWSDRCKEWLWRSQEELSLCIIERYICLRITHTLDVNFLVFLEIPTEIREFSVMEAFYAQLQIMVNPCPRISPIVLGDFIATTGTERDDC